MSFDALTIDPKNADSGQVRANPGAKLLNAARDLFYSQGYHLAGINEIIARSGTSKKSFYRYYPAKRELGQAYLAAEQRAFGQYLRRLMERHTGDYRGFVRAWAYTMRRSAAGRYRYGCPFANLLAQTGAEFAGEIAQAMSDWQARLERYLVECDLQLSPDMAPGLVRMILMQYQGAIQMWRLSGEPEYFERFEAGLLQLASLSSGHRAVGLLR